MCAPRTRAIALELPLARRRWGRPEKLLPSLSEAPCAGLVKLTRGGWPGTGCRVPAGMGGIRNRTPAPWAGCADRARVPFSHQTYEVGRSSSVF